VKIELYSANKVITFLKTFEGVKDVEQSKESKVSKAGKNLL
jgi:hypothetical protein